MEEEKRVSTRYSNYISGWRERPVGGRKSGVSSVRIYFPSPFGSRNTPASSWKDSCDSFTSNKQAHSRFRRYGLQFREAEMSRTI